MIWYDLKFEQQRLHMQLQTFQSNIMKKNNKMDYLHVVLTFCLKKSYKNELKVCCMMCCGML